MRGVPRQPPGAAQRAGPHHPDVAERGQRGDRGQKKQHEERDAVERAARGAERFDAERDLNRGEADRHQQRRGVQRASPRRWLPDRGQRRHDEIGGHEAAQDVGVGQALPERQDRPADAHREHRVDEQDPAAAVQRGALRGQQRHAAEDDRKSAGNDVNGQQHENRVCTE